MATENVSPQRGSGGVFTLSLGFGRSQQQAVSTATASLRAPFPLTALAYANTWNAYDRTLNRPPRSVPGQSAQTISKTYSLDANVLKASEDKTFPGAVAASLASPWGQAINAGDDVNGEPVYYGSYREVFARDSYEAFTGFLADGDLATARAQAKFLLDDQQLPTGEIPRNSLLNGKAAPDTGGDQLDETADPILMAYLSGLGGDDTLWTQHIKPAADFLVAHGPSFGVERWEEQSGYSPSTIAAEIAGRPPPPPSRPSITTPPTPRSTRPPRTTSSATWRAGRSPRPGPTAPLPTSSGCPRPATRTPRPPTT